MAVKPITVESSSSGATVIGHVGKLAWVAQAIAWRGAFCVHMDWSKLTHLQLGKYGEYYAKMEFAKAGFDIYSAEVDDKGIDFVVRNERGKYFEIQVKSIRKKSAVFMRKKVFQPRTNMYLALLIFEEALPSFALIPSIDWENTNRPVFLVDRNYDGKKSAPEFGINISVPSLIEIERRYSFAGAVSRFHETILSSVEKSVVKMSGEGLQHD
jgi:hypothetical protein